MRTKDKHKEGAPRLNAPSPEEQEQLLDFFRLLRRWKVEADKKALVTYEAALPRQS